MNKVTSFFCRQIYLVLRPLFSPLSYWRRKKGKRESFAFAFPTPYESQTYIPPKPSRFCVIGGGAAIAAIEGIAPEGKLGFLSTGGVAMLEYLLKGTLPAIEVLK